MPYNPDKHHRRSIRLKNFDYTKEGYYLVTICTQDRAEIFGTVSQNNVNLNEAGIMIDDEWKRIPDRFSHVYLDIYQIMPNHIHGILQIKYPEKSKNKITTLTKPENVIETSETGTVSAPIFNIVGTFKSLTQKKYAFHVRNSDWPAFRRRLWQLRFYDRIIRNELELNRIRKYVLDNPLNWKNDENHPDNMEQNVHTNP